MDRRAILKSFGSVMAWPRALRSRLSHAISENNLTPGFVHAASAGEHTRTRCRVLDMEWPLKLDEFI